MDDKSTTPQLVRFEEVTPANEPAAFLNVDLDSLVAPLNLPIYNGYDGLDDMRFSFLTLPSGETVMLGAYLTCPQPGTDLYVDKQKQWKTVAQIVFEACQYLNLDRSTVSWFHPDFQVEIDDLCTNNPPNLQERRAPQVEELLQLDLFEPINCFNHAISIYDRANFPQYWAMLQRNLGLAYFNRAEGDLRDNLERSIVCLQDALEIHTSEGLTDQQGIDNEDLATARQSLNKLNIESKENSTKTIIAQKMDKYEIMYILSPDLSDEQTETAIEKYKNIIKTNGATDIEIQKRSKCRLTYPIGNIHDGIYVQINYTGSGKEIAPLERAMRLSEDVIRYLSLKLCPTKKADKAAADNEVTV
jgi:small subunit ribosomal protein S6